MKDDKILQLTPINTDADPSIRGYELQKLRVVARLFNSLSSNKDSICCTIEYKDDIYQKSTSDSETNIEFEQNKSYTSKDFSINSDEIKKSIRIFMDNWRNAEYSENISFVFFTSADITSGQRNTGVLKSFSPEEQNEVKDINLLDCLVKKDYTKSLKYIIAIIKDYYIDSHKDNGHIITFYEQYINNLSDENWISFFDLIEWNFNAPSEAELRNNLKSTIIELCHNFSVNDKFADTILALALDKINSKMLEKDYLKKLVHTSEIKLLFYELHREAQIKSIIDPLGEKWPDVKLTDFRNLEEKIYSISPNFDSDLFDIINDDLTDGLFIFDRYYDKKQISSYKYRIYKDSKKYILKNILKKGIKQLNTEELELAIDDISNYSYNMLLSWSQTYQLPFNDLQSVYYAILILLRECYIAFDSKGDDNDDGR